MISGLPLSLLM